MDPVKAYLELLREWAPLADDDPRSEELGERLDKAASG
jgi:hypothetical protein